MKKLALSLSLLFGIFTALLAGSVEHTYSFNKYDIAGSAEAQTIGFSQSLLTGLPGEPVLPYQSVKLLLPPGESAVSIEVIGSGEITIPGSFRLAAQQYVQPLSKGGSGIVLKNEAVYKSASIYPATLTGKLITSFLNGHSVALSSFTPLRYIPSTGQVSYYSTVKVIIHTEKTEAAAAALANYRTSPAINNELDRFSDNPRMLDSYQIDSPATSDSYDILIITPSAFAGSFASLANAYLKEGLITNIATTEQISADMFGIDLPEKMRKYIIQEYQQHGIQYVVLGGDDEIVPHRGFFCHVQSSSVYEDYNIPADLYFSALDGTWNTDNDDMWGEPGEDDLLPEVSVGRLSFSNQFELQHMLNKTYSYQFAPVPGEFQKVLFAGENLWSDPLTWGSDYLELLIGYRTDNGYSTTGIPGAYQLNKLYDENANWGGYDLISSLNQGYPSLQHSGHANETYVMKLSNPDITDANFYNLNGINHNFSVVYTHGCLCGAFDSDDCIAEKMVSISNFAAAFVGNSRYGWFNEGQTEGPSAHLHREFIDAMYFDRLNRAGRAHVESKIATAPWVTAPGQWEPGALRWCFYDCNLLGDPAMAIWTNNAIPILTTYPSSIQIGCTGVNISVKSNGMGVVGLNCVVIMNGVMLGKAVTNENGEAFITFDAAVQTSGSAELTVSGYNCLPTSYAISVGQTIGMEDAAAKTPAVRLLSNPVNQILSMEYELPASEIVSISLIAADGKTILISKDKKEDKGVHQLQWDASKLAPGTYNCRLSSGNQLVNQRFVKF